MPDWVCKYKEKGTTIRKKGNKYYKYRVHSQRVEGKSYPVLIQDEFLGIITEDGFSPAARKIVNPGETVIKSLDMLIDTKNIDKNDKKAFKEVYLMKINGDWFFSKTTEKQKQLMERYNIGDINGKLDANILRT